METSIILTNIIPRLVRVKTKHGYYLPKLVRTEEELIRFFRNHHFPGHDIIDYQMVINPKDDEKFEEKIQSASELFPDPDAIEDAVMENYDGHMTAPGYPTVYTLPNGDPGYPGEGPEFENLPDEDMYRSDIKETWSDELLKSLGYEDGIYSLEISDNDRQFILDFADDYCGDWLGGWLDTEGIIDRFGIYPEPDYDEY